MKYCYISGIPITDKNDSVEHILPNALGGRLKSKGLLCKDVNSKLGSELDIELANYIPLPTILNIKRDRKKPPAIQAIDEFGKKHIVKSATEIEMQHQPIEEKKDEEGRVYFEVPDTQEKHLKKFAKKKYPEKSDEQIEKETHEVQYNEGQAHALFFENHFNVISGHLAFRAIAKIATNFYVYQEYDTKYISKSIEFIRGIKHDYDNVRYFYSKNIIEIEKEEVSHIIHLIGDPSEKLLYCYIELFNCHNFLVLLNENYIGPEIKDTYSFDVLKQIELQKEELVRMKRDDFLKSEHPYPSDVEEQYTKRLKRVANIGGFTIEEKNF